MTDLYPIENYKALAMAVVEPAAKDYMRYIRAAKKYEERYKKCRDLGKRQTLLARLQTATGQAKACERFFKSDRFDIFMSGAVSGDDFIRALKRRALDPSLNLKED